jgi:hypothetical protein
LEPRAGYGALQWSRDGLARFAATLRINAMQALPRGNPRTYNVCFSVNGGRFLHKLDQGVALGDDGLTWTMDGQATEMPLGNIVAVHLWSAGQSTIVDQCAITFADDSVLCVVNSDPGGFTDRERVPIYRDFVRDLHARLAAGPGAGIRFTAGVPRWRYWATLAAMIVLAVLGGGLGLVTWVDFRNLQGLAILALGGYACWWHGRKLLANAPRDYTPDHLPEELLS